MRKKKILWAVLAIVVGLLVWHRILIVAHIIKCEKMEDKLRTVEIGMAREQVRSIVGEPKKISQSKFGGKRWEEWEWLQRTGSSEFTYCTFNADTGKLVEVVIFGNLEKRDAEYQTWFYQLRESYMKTNGKKE